MTNKPTVTNYEDQLNDLLLELQTVFDDLKGLVIKLKNIDGPFKRESHFLIVQSKIQTLFNTNGDIEQRVSQLFATINSVLKLLEQIVEDDEVRDLYSNAGILDEMMTIRNHMLKVLEKFT